MKALEVLARLRAGDALHVQFLDGRRTWWFENPHQVVTDRMAIAIVSNDAAGVREAGDSLFGFPLNSQTFLGPEQ